MNILDNNNANNEQDRFFVYGLIALFLAGIVSGIILISKDAPYDPSRKYVRVEDAVSPKTIFLASGSYINLWGVDVPNSGKPGLRDATKALRQHVEERKISYIEMKSVDSKYKEVRAFLSDGREINRILIETRAAKEKCSISQNFYGTCNK